jgi:HEPN domain-containing protein
LKRQDLRELALPRLKEAQVLFANGCWSGAYYLAGYAVECALKACIAKTTERHEFPDKERVNRSYTHKLNQLLQVADLDGPLREAEQKQPQLALSWLSVKQWSAEARYERRSESDAEALLKAVQDRKDGVLPWLKKHW